MKYVMLLILALLQVVLAVVLGYKKHSKVSRIFILFAFNMAIWTVANTLLDYYQYQVKDQLAFVDIVNRFGFFSATLSLITVYRLSLVFPLEKAKTKGQTIITAIGLVVPFLALFPAVSGSFTQSSPGAVPEYKYGPLVLAVGVYIMIVAALSIGNIVQAFRSVEPKIKRQAYTVFAGLMSSIALAAFFIIVLPTITGSEKYIFIGYFAPILFTGTVLYSIMRQQLLDFRRLIARSIAYTLLITITAAIYAVFIFGISSQVLGGTQLNLIQQAFFVAGALFLAFSFPPIKRFIDRFTNTVFYRDAYDAQAMLNDFNSSLVASINLQSIMKNTVLLIEHYLKSTDIAFMVYGDKSKDRKFYSSTNRSSEMYEASMPVLQSFTQKAVAIEGGEALSKVQKELVKKLDIGMLAQIKSSKNTLVGSVMLGPKKSGNPYDTQDLRVMEIIADELVIAIQNALHFEEIQQFNITLQEKVDKATVELRKANQKLIAMDQTKDDFISMASHQLRTPLTSVKGYVSMVLEGDVGKVNKEQKKLLDQAFLSSQRMVYLIADLLNVSRLKTGKFVIESKPTNLADLVETELDQLKETATARELTITYNKPKDFPVLDMDETKIRQVVMNFADNAIYYTPTGGHIDVAVVDKGETVEFTVTDDGIGVPKAEQHNLFTKFYRAGNAKKARPDGTGLGLFMARKVVIAQGGVIIFKTEEGKGSTFGFSFEKKKLQAGTHSVKVNDEEESLAAKA